MPEEQWLRTPLVAPLTVEKDGFVAAGSTVTSKVGESQLAVGRAKQRNIDGYFLNFSKVFFVILNMF